MLTSTLFAAAAALVGFASAQNGSDIVYNGQNYSVSGPIAVPPETVPLATRQLWCNTQQQQCPQICNVPTLNNTCDSATLTFNCTCQGSTQPNITNYQQSLPALVCGQWVENCVDSHPNDKNGLDGCHSVMCGNETIAVGGSSTTSMSSSTTSSAGTGGSATPAASTTTTSSTSSFRGAATALAFAHEYGTPLMAGGMVALFGLAL